MSNTDHLYMPENHMDELYNSGNPLVKFVHRQRLNEIAKLVPNADGLKILDAGCGEGHLLQKLYQKNNTNDYYGVDITPIALEKARLRFPQGKYYLANLAKMDFTDNFFDVIVITEVLEHVIDYEIVVNELKRVLKSGGILIITFPNEVLWTVSRFFLRRRPVKILDHVNSFTPDFLQNILQLKLTAQRNLPFRLPFSVSLGALMVFKK